MTEPEIMAGVAQIVHDVLGNATPTITQATAATDVPGWDSVRMVEIILRVEEHFAVRLPSREVDRLRNVGDLVSAVRDRLA